MAVDLVASVVGWVVSQAASAAARAFRRGPDRRALERAVEQALDTALATVDADVRDDVRGELARCFTGLRPLTSAEWGAGRYGLRTGIAERLARLDGLEHADTGFGFVEVADVEVEWLADQLAAALELALREVAAAAGLHAFVDNVNFVTLLDLLIQINAKLDNAAPDRTKAAPVTNRIDGTVVGTVVQAESIHGDVHVHRPTAATVAIQDLPCPVGLVGLPRSPGLFLGREDDLRAVSETLGTCDPMVVAAVHGLGGVGKSALALQYATDHQDEYAPVWWITVDQTGITQGLADLAQALQPALLGSTPIEELAQWARRWLITHTRWLLVLDNVENPTEILDMLAGIRHGRVLITSRRATGWHDIATPYRLDTLPPKQAEELLTRIITHDIPEADLTGASKLNDNLGGLPLAIRQAGAYIAQTRATPGAYLDALRTTPALYRHTTDETDPEGQRTVARVWHHTMRHLVKLNPLTLMVLRVSSWYAPEHIPIRLFTDGAVDAVKVREAVGLLRAYSLLAHHGDTLSVHRLVQTVIRGTVTSPSFEIAIQSLVEALNPDATDPGSLPAYKSLSPHIDALTSHIPDGYATIAIMALHRLAGRHLFEHGNPTYAVEHLRHAHVAAERVLGADHAATLATRTDLASAYRAAGNLDEAIQLYEAVIADYTRIFASNHPRTLVARNNLALALQVAGQPDRAVVLYQAVLTDQERVLEPDHPRF